jgi:hypothetical protein
MRKRLISASLLLAVGCTTTAPPPPPPATVPAAPAPRPVSANALEDHGGDSPDTAIDVPQTAKNGGVDFENEWIFNRFGRFRRRGGGTGALKDRRYDVVKIELPNGEEKTVYFDITENWKTWTPPQ